MVYNYHVLIEKHEGQYRIAAVTDNKMKFRIIPAQIASRGMYYDCIDVEYPLTYKIEKEFYLVYPTNSEIEDETSIYPMFSNGRPTKKDFFMYKIETSASNRVNKLNEELNDAAKAVMIKMEVDKVY